MAEPALRRAGDEGGASRLVGDVGQGPGRGRRRGHGVTARCSRICRPSTWSPKISTRPASGRRRPPASTTNDSRSVRSPPSGSRNSWQQLPSPLAGDGRGHRLVPLHLEHDGRAGLGLQLLGEHIAQALGEVAGAVACRGSVHPSGHPECAAYVLLVHPDVERPVATAGSGCSSRWRRTARAPAPRIRGRVGEQLRVPGRRAAADLVDQLVGGAVAPAPPRPAR